MFWLWKLIQFVGYFKIPYNLSTSHYLASNIGFHVVFKVVNVVNF